jgi:two-component system, OmpR family, response regulator ChvI
LTTNPSNNSKKDNNSYHHHKGATQNESVRYKILLVDDDPDILLTFKSGLEEVQSTKVEGVNLHVDIFAEPREALTSFKAGVYDLLLLDIRMPNINGFELYEELKKIDDKPKVCFITAYELYYEALKKDFPELDIGCFIKKPISIEDLAIKIREELA